MLVDPSLRPIETVLGHFRLDGSIILIFSIRPHRRESMDRLRRYAMLNRQNKTMVMDRL